MVDYVTSYQKAYRTKHILLPEGGDFTYMEAKANY